MVRPVDDLRISIAGGGTGGHLFPAVAAMERILEDRPQARFLLHGTPRDIVGQPEEGIEREVIDSPRLGRSLAERALFPARFARALSSAVRSHRRFRPHCVVGLGGYGSVASIVAARIVGRPVVLLEQNAVPGKANRALSRLATAVGVSHRAAGEVLGTRAELTGNPIRRSLMGRSPDHAAFGLDPERPVLAIVGGSLGSRAINRALSDAANAIASAGIQVIHVTGEADAPSVSGAYRRAGVPSFVAPFVDDIGAVWATADLALCRAGGTTVAELAAVGLPSVLVPLTIHADCHQARNAEALAAGGGAVVLDESSLDEATLLKEVFVRVVDREGLTRMRSCLATNSKSGAAERVAELLLRIAEGDRR